MHPGFAKNSFQLGQTGPERNALLVTSKQSAQGVSQRCEEAKQPGHSIESCAVFVGRTATGAALEPALHDLNRSSFLNCM